jgi:hypothetical protein
MNILDNILSTVPPFPLLPLESLIKASYIFIGDFIQFDVQYRLTLSLTFELPIDTDIPSIVQEYRRSSLITIRSVDELNHFTTIRYQNTLTLINQHWNDMERPYYVPGQSDR